MTCYSKRYLKIHAACYWFCINSIQTLSKRLSKLGDYGMYLSCLVEKSNMHVCVTLPFPFKTNKQTSNKQTNKQTQNKQTNKPKTKQKKPAHVSVPLPRQVSSSTHLWWYIGICPWVFYYLSLRQHQRMLDSWEVYLPDCPAPPWNLFSFLCGMCESDIIIAVDGNC